MTQRNAMTPLNKVSQPRISVTVATFRRRVLLEQVIRAIENQTIDRSQYEVIVCDSASADGTAELMADLMTEFPNLRYYDIDVNTLAAKRNVGIRQARGGIVVFLDDDAIPGKDFVAAHLAAHVSGSFQFVCGNVQFPEEWVSKSNYFRFRNSRHLGPSRPEINLKQIPYPMIVVMNGSFQKHHVVDRVGPVSEEFQRYGGEDYEFGYRVAKAGMAICFAADAKVQHFEHGGSLLNYMKKLYITSRDSLPVLYRLAPGARETALSRLLETRIPGDSWKSRLSHSVLRMALAPWLVNLVEYYLDKTDASRFLYSPLLFRYAFAGAMLRGIRDRERVHNNGSTTRIAPQTPVQTGGWFE